MKVKWDIMGEKKKEKPGTEEVAFKILLGEEACKEIDDEIEESQKQTITRNLLTYCCANDHVEELSLQSTNFSNISMTLLENCIMKLKKM